MSEVTERLNEELDKLRTARDELRVQLHLGAAEAKELWEKLEHSWENAELELEKLRDASQESAEDIGTAARLLVSEIRDGYKRLREKL